jgi:anti-sigma factor RsiW
VDTGAYALGQLGPIATVRLRSHLAKCAACRAELSELAEVAA